MSQQKITSCFVELKNRGLIKAGGEDAHKFLQNVITNDMDKITDKPLHACLLTAQGKFLHDFFVFKDGDTYILDCEGGDRAQDLLKRLTLYRLRAKVTLEVTPLHSSFVILKSDTITRSLEKPDLPETDFASWDRQRIALGMADGSRDAEIEKSTLAELNLEDAIDYTKGCYIGQELTARIHHRGLSKRHLFRVRFAGNAPEWGTALVKDGKAIGEMRSSQGDIGLALLKDEFLPSPVDGFYMLDT